MTDMYRLTFTLCDVAVTSTELRWCWQNKPKQWGMADELACWAICIRSALLGTLIRKCARGFYNCTCSRKASEYTTKRSALLAMSMDREAARALNCLARESLHFFGSGDGPALAYFLQDYFCRDDSAYESPGKYPHTSFLPNRYY